MLVENTLMGEVDKVQIAIARLREFEPEEGYYLAFSGGKDSQAVYHLVEMSGVKFDAHFNLTTVDPPELIHFIRAYYPDVEVHKPEKTMWQLIVENGMPPTRLIRYCCKVLKEGGGSGRKVITGVRWEESVKRSKRRMVEVCMKNDATTYLHPIIDWSEAEVWEYLNDVAKVPHCVLYDKGWHRIGCIGCPMGRANGMERQFEQYPTYRRAYTNAFAKMIEERKRKGLAEKPNWDTPENVMHWWIHGKEKEGYDQTIMLE